MSDALDDLRDQMTSWYLGLDDRTRSYFEAAYGQAPDVIVNSIGAPGVTADQIAQHASLASLFDADPAGDISKTFPYIGGDGPLVVEPANPVADEAFVVRWNDINWGASSAGYEDRFVVIDSENNAVFSVDVDIPALEAGGRTSMEISVPDVPAGTHTLRVLHNSYGIDPAYPQYASRKVGFHSYSELVLEVAEQRVGDSSAAMAYERGNLERFEPEETDEEEYEAPAPMPQPAAQTAPLNLATVPMDEAYPDPVDDFADGTAEATEPQAYESLVTDGGFDDDASESEDDAEQQI